MVEGACKMIGRQVTPFLTAAIIATCLIVAGHYVNTLYRDLVPVSSWMQVTSIIVPDHKVGDDPIVVTTRPISKSLLGQWTAEVHRIGNGQVCSGSGYASYRLDEPDVTRFRLSEYVNSDCSLKKGQYIILLTIALEDEKGTRKYIHAASDSFKVS